MSDTQTDSSLLIANRAKQLKNIEFFQGFSDSELIKLSEMMKIIKFKKNTTVINQGDLSSSLFVIVYGRLKVSATDEEGNQTIFTFLHDGDYFGELSLLDEAPRSATITTVEDCTVLNLDHTMFKDFLNAHPTVCWSLFKALTSKIRNMDEKICSLTSKDIHGRLIETIYKHADVDADGVLKTQKLTHQDFAEMVGSSREMVSRIFKELKADGYISVDKKQISILKRLPSEK